MVHLLSMLPVFVVGSGWIIHNKVMSATMLVSCLLCVMSSHAPWCNVYILSHLMKAASQHHYHNSFTSWLMKAEAGKVNCGLLSQLNLNYWPRKTNSNSNAETIAIVSKCVSAPKIMTLLQFKFIWKLGYSPSYLSFCPFDVNDVVIRLDTILSSH